ncbi:DNA-binding MarR family transcriptional regulator [Variovorax boronicumulans]|uniref:MarR family winged helix-turn-helix transcriptional regulator n=1 Tax=Variovorax boronicumulans TaxID=436515 RepID=UPI0024750C9B|nr:MarR family transcriptional regulator [Variovorax boronicumulans]MDH6167905.1 DNA-binding MarR family transcriptional regulator [Variovorax boronicumulans]
MRDFPDAVALRTPRSIDDLLLYRIWRAARASNGMVTRMIEGGFGITRRELGMMGVLVEMGEITASQFAEHLDLDRASASIALRSLTGKKLVERRQDSEDRRLVHVRLSPSGRQLFDELLPRLSHLDVDLLDGIDAAHLEVFLDCLERLEMRGDELDARRIAREKWRPSIDRHVSSAGGAQRSEAQAFRLR